MIKLLTPNQGGFHMNIIATKNTLHNHFYKFPFQSLSYQTIDQESALSI